VAGGGGRVVEMKKPQPRKSIGWKCPAEIFMQEFDFKE